jgi:hypothetical protein
MFLPYCGAIQLECWTNSKSTSIKQQNTSVIKQNSLLNVNYFMIKPAKWKANGSGTQIFVYRTILF